jgi:hypothetical protein
LLVEPFAFFEVGGSVVGGVGVEGGEVAAVFFVVGAAAVEDFEAALAGSSSPSRSGSSSSDSCCSSPSQTSAALLTPTPLILETIAIVVRETVGVDKTIVILSLPPSRNASHRSGTMSDRDTIPALRRRRRLLHERRIGSR